MEPTNVPAVFYAQAARLGDRAWLHHHRDGDWRTITWREGATGVSRIAAALARAGVQPGERVALISENRPEWLLCDLGIQAAGAVTVPIYTSSPPGSVHSVLKNSEAVFAIASTPALAEKLGQPGHGFQVALMDDAVAAWLGAEAPAEADAAEVERRLGRLGRDDLATIVYTSGTTGEPKGAMLAHRNLVDMAASSLAAIHVGEEDVILSALPYAHVFERVSGIFVGIRAGATIWLSRGIDRLVDDVAAVRPTVILGVPRIFEKVRERVLDTVRSSSALRRGLFEWAQAAGRRDLPVEHAVADRLVLGRLRERLTGGRLRFFVSGGAPLGIDVERFFWDVGIPILQGWGMTELSSGATLNTLVAHRWGTVGRALPGVEIKIAEDQEILVRSPGLMLGYHANPEATAEVMAGGMLRTGDLGSLDPDGYLIITGRKKELMKTSTGKYVAPMPIEEKLMADPAIEWAVLIGDTRPFVSALIVPDWAALARRGIEGPPDRLAADPRVREVVQAAIDSANQELGSWESVKKFTILPYTFSEEGGELTPTLKPKRRVLAERFAKEIEGMYAGHDVTRAGAARR